MAGSSNVPHKTSLPEGIRVGTVMRIRGVVPDKAVVGDSEYHHFRYRIPPARVRLLEVGGDLQLDSVKIF
ncbi:PREDICTED: galectin-7 [Odobenus rosmarus divergens]|uniref:Galectin-7 n=1 Tax=Odobenus rosmarus divergens TaxID=9708 RepID=A0A2U3VNA7_ODORO|nr:PREDICTED: galectin-7 [Odobenus rosmarus divergens]